MIELTLWEEGFPKIRVHPDNMWSFKEEKRRPHWKEGGRNDVTLVGLSNGKSIVVCESYEQIQKRCEEWKRTITWTPADGDPEPGLPAYVRGSLHKEAVAMAHLWLSARVAKYGPDALPEGPMTMHVYARNMEWGETLLNGRRVRIVMEVVDGQ